MTWPTTFTPEMDAKIIAAIEGGARDWHEVGAAVGKASALVYQRVKRVLHRDDLVEKMRPARPLTMPPDDTARRSGAEALPVGHPLTWGLIIAGTVLDPDCASKSRGT